MDYLRLPHSRKIANNLVRNEQVSGEHEHILNCISNLKKLIKTIVTAMHGGACL